MPLKWGLTLENALLVTQFPFYSFDFLTWDTSTSKQLDNIKNRNGSAFNKCPDCQFCLTSREQAVTNDVLMVAHLNRLFRLLLTSNSTILEKFIAQNAWVSWNVKQYFSSFFWFFYALVLPYIICSAAYSLHMLLISNKKNIVRVFFISLCLIEWDGKQKRVANQASV